VSEPIDPGVLELAGRVFDLARAGATEELVGYVDAGVPANLTNDKGDTLLILAAYHGHPDTVAALLERGAGNPLFRGALGMYDNVVLLQSDRVARAANATSVNVATNLFLGAQALARGYAYYPDWTEQYFSYGEEQGIGTYVVVGEKAIVFDLNSSETSGDATDDTAIGFCQVLTEAPAGIS